MATSEIHSCSRSLDRLVAMIAVLDTTRNRILARLLRARALASQGIKSVATFKDIEKEKALDVAAGGYKAGSIDCACDQTSYKKARQDAMSTAMQVLSVQVVQPWHASDKAQARVALST